MASFVLLALGGERAQLEGAVKYVTLNLLSSAIFLAAVGLLYGVTDTLNMADLAGRLEEVEEPGFVTALAGLFMVAFGIKAALFPLFFWLPASYHTTPVAVSALFAGLLTKVGVYALLRAFTLLFVGDVSFTHTVLLVAAGLTMLTGPLGALAQRELRRTLSFPIVGHIGFPIMGLGLFASLGLAGAIFYIVEDIIVLTGLFMIAGVVHRSSEGTALADLGGLYLSRPGLAVPYLAAALVGFAAATRRETGLAAAALGLAAMSAGVLSMAIAWVKLPRPFLAHLAWSAAQGLGVGLYADDLNMFFAVLVAGVGLLTMVYSIGYVPLAPVQAGARERREAHCGGQRSAHSGQRYICSIWTVRRAVLARALRCRGVGRMDRRVCMTT